MLTDLPLNLHSRIPVSLKFLKQAPLATGPLHMPSLSIWNASTFPSDPSSSITSQKSLLPISLQPLWSFHRTAVLPSVSLPWFLGCI